MMKHWKQIAVAAGLTLSLGTVMVAYGHPGPDSASMYVPSGADTPAIWFWRILHFAVAGCLFALGWTLGGPARERSPRSGQWFSVALGVGVMLPLLAIMAMDFGPGEGSWLPVLIGFVTLGSLALLVAVLSGSRVLAHPHPSTEKTPAPARQDPPLETQTLV